MGLILSKGNLSQLKRLVKHVPQRGVIYQFLTLNHASNLCVADKINLAITVCCATKNLHCKKLVGKNSLK